MKIDNHEISEEQRNFIESLIKSYIFDSIATIEERFFYACKNIEVIPITNVHESILYFKNKIREDTKGFCKIKDIIMSDSCFNIFKKENKIDEEVKDISICGIKIKNNVKITDNKILMIYEPKDKMSVPIEKRVIIMEIKNDAY